MIKTEQYEINGRSFTRTWSDAGRYVVREGIEYAEANDPTEFGRTYTEGDYLPDEELPDMDEILEILLGEAE